MTVEIDKRAPMASAPMKYLPDGSVDWGNMWDSFCVLAKEGGPPHRPTMLYAQESANTESEGYHSASGEIIRGIHEVSRLMAYNASPGWIAIQCSSAGQAQWLCKAIEEENVQARSDGAVLLVPVGENYTLKGEIKNVITAVAKTTHYWQDHIPAEVKQAMALEDQLAGLKRRIKGLFRRSTA